MEPDVMLRQVDKIEIVTLMDNYVDLLLGSTAVITRPPRAKGEEIPTDTFLAEHGLSLLVTVFEGKEKHTVLFDTGYTEIGVPHNLEMLGLDLKGVEAIVLSHAHMDHTGALYALLEKIQRPIPLFVHPGAFVFPRYKVLDDGKKLLFPRTLIRSELEARGVEVRETKAPTLLAEGMMMVSGEVDRLTSFEKGLPNALVEKNGRMEKDSIPDDQALVLHLKDRGLVVISGCSHAGIVNTVLYARKISGVEKIHAVVGGFHLGGPAFEPIVEDTIESLKKMAPKIVVPMHCTGWSAVHRFSKEFPAAFTLNSVGSTIVLA
jgi:7,8-dihydropterin-6-yl-methyl-4-(beta-D-ribofuranosyl)aminobenzene 5'-phosphate synthase